MQLGGPAFSLEKSMKKTLLIDGNSIGHACHHSKELTANGMQVQAIFGFLKTMRSLRQQYPQHTPLILWDGRAQWRFDIHPEYKTSRESDAEKIAAKNEYTQQKPYILNACEALGVRQLLVSTHEADDLAGYMVKKLAGPDHEIEMITGDKDWAQLVRPGVTWRDLRDDSRTITFDTFLDKTGYATPYAFLEGKCLQGDGSDDISGVGGIGEKGAPLVLAEFGSVREFWRRCDSGEYVPTKKALLSLWKGTSPLTSDEWASMYVGDADDKKAVKKHMDLWPGQGRLLFSRNLKLMQLLKVPEPEKANTCMIRGKLEVDKFKAICDELAFMSISSNIDTFVDYFKD